MGGRQAGALTQVGVHLLVAGMHLQDADAALQGGGKTGRRRKRARARVLSARGWWARREGPGCGAAGCVPQHVAQQLQRCLQAGGSARGCRRSGASRRQALPSWGVSSQEAGAAAALVGCYFGCKACADGCPPQRWAAASALCGQSGRGGSALGPAPTGGWWRPSPQCPCCPQSRPSLQPGGIWGERQRCWVRLEKRAKAEDSFGARPCQPGRHNASAAGTVVCRAQKAAGLHLQTGLAPRGRCQQADVLLPQPPAPPTRQPPAAPQAAWQATAVAGPHLSAAG